MNPTRRSSFRFPVSAGAAIVALGTALAGSGVAQVELDDLLRPVRVTTDIDGTPHIVAENDRDALRVQGYLHAADRLFQMDYLRRLFGGSLAELLGQSALESDVQLRTLGFRRAAEESFDAMAPEARSLLRAYAEGVNAWLETHSGGLPDEYAALELTQVRPWDPVDTLTIVKGILFARSFDFTFEIEATLTLLDYQRAGAQRGFDGSALFFEDLFRTAPFDPAVTTRPTAPVANQAASVSSVPLVSASIRPETERLARRLAARWRDARMPFVRGGGSNAWAVSGGIRASGKSLLANDPHLGLDSPALWHESHLTVSDDPAAGPMDAIGVTVAGVPGVAAGCGANVCWGITTNPADIADTFQESLAVDSVRGTPTHTLRGGTPEALIVLPQSYRANQPGNGTSDDVVPVPLPPLQGGNVFLVPRRNNGPLIMIDGAAGLSFQYTGSRDTRDWEGLFHLSRARDVGDFGRRLALFDATFNFVCADRQGAIGYFASGEIPLRDDLQNLGRVDGLPPFLIRDGTGQARNDWLPVAERAPTQSLRYRILPADELPQIVGLPSDTLALSLYPFLVNANNDPFGDLQDNDAVNQTRAGGGIRYLLWQSLSLRAGAIGRRLAALVAQGGEITLDQMREIQSSSRFADAEYFRPLIPAALENARRVGAPPLLAGLAGDARIVEAVQRLQAWDLSSPTGVREGYDAGDDPNLLPEPTAGEIAHSVAATLYAMWRGRALVNIIDATVARVGLGGAAPRDFELPLTALKNLFDNFATRSGRGASGVDFFPVAGLGAADARDYLILKSLRDALDLAAGPAFAPAFGRSANQNDYRWGRLHRIVFRHPLGGPFNIPPAGGFQGLSGTLPGLARQGGFETIDNGPGGLRGNSVDSFVFSSGASMRLTAEPGRDRIDGSLILAGGQSGRRESPFFASQLGRWLVNGHHPLRVQPEDLEGARFEEFLFAPSRYRLFFPYFETNSAFFSGFAAASLVDAPQTIAFEARASGGGLVSAPANPAFSALAPGRQLARLAEQIFGLPPGQASDGWVLLTSDLGASNRIPLASFAQFGGFDLNRLDGAVAASDPSSRLIFTRAYEGPDAFRGQSAETVLSVANIGDQSTPLRLRYFGPGAAGPPITAQRLLPARGVLTGSLSELFQQPMEARGGYVEAVASAGEIVGFELLRLRGSASLVGLNAALGEPGGLLFSAQAASGPEIFTNLKLVNLADQPRVATLRQVAGDGSPLGDPEEIRLEAGESREMDLGRAEADTTQVGSLRLEVDGAGIVGDVLFASPDLGYAAALQLQGRLFEEAVFPHVANLFGVFFSGLALYNPSAAAAEVEISVFAPDGTAVGSSIIELASGARLSQTLDQLVPASLGQVGGYVVVRSSQPLVGQELFGTVNLSLLSAVPPTRLR